MCEHQGEKLPLLRRIHLKNLLSFGPEGIDLDLPRLTVLIGPNGSGKSNLLAGRGETPRRTETGQALG